jgi:hypothetical protein
MPSIFNSASVFTTYTATLQFRNKLMGGIPRDPAIVEAWLRSKAGITQQEELFRATLRTAVEMGVARPDMNYDELEAVSKELAQSKQTNGFKRDEGGLYIEGRGIKAMLKESVAILYPYAKEKWTATKKAPRAAVAERVFPPKQDRIHLDRAEPDGVDLFIGHTSGPKGPQSNLTYYEYVETARISFDILVCEDEVPLKAWERIWVHAQENGLGALRSQGHGRFDVEQWEPAL